MWKLMHRLFGFHYVILPWGFGGQKILRVRTLKVTEEKYIVLFGTWYFLKPDGHCEDGRKYRPLTWELDTTKGVE